MLFSTESLLKALYCLTAHLLQQETMGSKHNKHVCEVQYVFTLPEQALNGPHLCSGVRFCF